jgi:hypothetical protein
MAVDSVGCEVGPAVEFEAQVMVEGVPTAIHETKAVGK